MDIGKNNMNNWDKVADNIVFNLEILEHDVIANIAKSAKILDFGCGYGRITNQLYKLGYNDLTGVDTALNMVNRGLAQFPYLNLKHITDNTLPFTDNEFDAIILCAVFTCISKSRTRKNVIDEIKRILKPDGIIYLAEFTSKNSIRFTSKMGVPMWHSQQSELTSLLTGFKIINSKVTQNPTLSGAMSEISHIFAQKIA